jgi:luciferase family oxidoreductase group 1
MAVSTRPLFSVLDLAPVKQGGAIAESFHNTLDLAQHVERWGYTRFWLAEHHNMPGIASAATAVLIGYVAGGTTTLRVGSGGIMLPNHAPLVIAEQFGTLETLYPGRIDLGIGRAPGTDGATVRALRRDINSAEEFPEQLEELLGYLGPAEPGQLVRAVPGAGTNVPIWLLGSSTFSAQLAAFLGLPFAFAGHFAPQQMLEALYLYRQLFRASRWLDKPHAMVGIPMVAADTDEQARRLSTTSAQKFLQLVRGEPFLSAPPVDSMDGLWTPQERALVHMKLGAQIVGGPETIRQKVAAFLAETQADELIISSDLYNHSDRLRSYEIVADVMKNLATAPAELASAAH